MRTIKQILIIVFSIIIVFALTIVTSAKSIIAYDEYNVTKLDATSYGIEEYKGASETLSVPSQINGFAVKRINDYAFKDNTVVKYISFVSPLESIGEQAFVSNKTIVSVSLCDSITTIKALAFSGCTSLNSINLEDSSITEIPGYTFSSTALVNVELPTTCTSIGYSAFSNDTNLKKIVIPNSVLSIDSTAFDDCNNLVIYCYKGSYAETYAKTNSIPYVLIDDPQPTETTEPITETETATQPVTQPVKETYVVGDVNDDKSVTITDATMIQQVLAGLIPSDEKMLQRGNTSLNGTMDITDVTRIQQFLASVEVTESNVGETREYK